MAGRLGAREEMAALALPADLAALLKKHPSIGPAEGAPVGKAKLRCSITGHEMPATLEAVQQYIAGGRYKKAKAWYARPFEAFLKGELLELANEFLAPHKDDAERQLYCTATRRTVGRIPKKIVAHLLSGRFTRAVEARRAGKPLPGEEGGEEDEEQGSEVDDEEEEEEDEELHGGEAEDEEADEHAGGSEDDAAGAGGKQRQGGKRKRGQEAPTVAAAAPSAAKAGKGAEGAAAAASAAAGGKKHKKQRNADSDGAPGAADTAAAAPAASKPAAAARASGKKHGKGGSK